MINNAIKFSKEDSNINLNIHPINASGFLQIDIKDEGIGIPSEFIPHLFDISKKVTSLGTQNEQGSGLGLILCKEFVEAHNGKIWLKSSSSQGSEFSFTIAQYS